MSAPSTDLAAWLLSEGRLLVSLPELLDGLCGRLQAQGLSLARVNLEVRTLHPEVAVKLLVWGPNDEHAYVGPAVRVGKTTAHTLTHGTVLEIGLAHGAFDITAFKVSPLARIVEGAEEVRSRIPPAPAPLDFPGLADLRERGCTDYLALALVFRGGARSSLTFSSRKPGGFAEADLALLRGLAPLLSLCVDAHAQQNVTRSLLRTYLGAEPGERVLAGRIHRGDVERVEAAIWFSDLRGFTQKSAASEPGALVEWLNAWFGELAPAIEGEGGEILKFIGDAVLAIFPVTSSRSRAEACAAAVRAARKANAGVTALEARRGEPFAHGIALHLGEVQYGNIGAEHRLDFTVIGPAVNLASRVEGLCGRLGKRTLATEVVAQLSGEVLPEAGAFDLKGVPGAQRVFVVE